MHLRRITFYFLLASIVSAGCNPARKLAKDQYLLTKNELVIDNRSVSKEEMKGLIKQKTNRKILGLFRFHLWLYNLVDKEKTARKKAAWVEKTEKKNEFRRAKGKEPINTDKLIFREKLLRIGEEPTVLDSTLTERTKKQFGLYLFRKGFFNAVVTDTTIFKKNRHATVTYRIRCNQPYTLRNIYYSTKDSSISTILYNEKANSLLHSGDRFDEDVLEMERVRIATAFRNIGYYYFNKNYITYFDSDSSLNTHEVDIYLYVNRTNENVSEPLNLNPENHHAYSLNNIYIQTDYDLKNPIAIPSDSVQFNDYYFLSGSSDQPFRKEAILRAIFLRRGDSFRQSDLDYTYTRLTDLNVFKYIKIIFNEVPRNDNQRNYLLNVNIQLTPLPKQDYSIETEATQSGGNLGLAGSFGYRNKNTFKGAESFEFRIKGAVEALRNFNDSLAQTKLFFFNTFEIGPEINLNIKRLLFIPVNRVSRRVNPRTNITAGFNYQSRPDYTRRIANLSFGYVFRQTPKLTYYLYPIDINSVKADLSQSFSDKLQSILDLNLLNSYSTHIIPGGRYTFVLTDQSLKPLRSFYFLKVNLEAAGMTMMPLINSVSRFKTDGDGRKLILGIPFAQYIKPDFDVSYHQRFNQHNTLVYRLAAGWGIEGPNSKFLPFEKSFFGGGANSLRAWQARTLGPGSYKNTINIEQSGDIKIESNIEVRSSIFKILEGAAFIDAGNIWTTHEDLARPGAQLIAKNFLNDLAVGGGLGLRFDFSFFILRVDGAVKLHDPALDLGDRWVYTKHKFQLNDINLNLAIGYPF